MKLVHAADIHLDSPMGGLERYSGAPAARLRNATREAFLNLVRLCLEEQASLLAIAGDLYDGDWRDYNTGLFFAAQMSRLREAGVRVFLVRGNHDAASEISRQLRLPDNCRELRADRPETVVLEDLGVAVHGQSFPRREVREDLSLAYPTPMPGLFNLGLLHTCAGGREGHESYAPCRVEGLAAKGYDYWALGHVHQREVLREDPWIVFPGNLQGRHVREAGRKGCSLVEVEEGRVLSVTHRDLDVLRWCRAEVDATGAAGVDEVVERVRAAIQAEVARADGRSLAVRVVIAGSAKAHGALLDDPEGVASEIRAQATDSSAGEAWVEKVEVETRSPVDVDALAGRDDPLGGLVRALRELRGDGAALAELAGRDLAELKRKLPPEARQGADGLDLDDPGTLGRLLGQAERLLVPRLLPPEEVP